MDQFDGALKTGFAQLLDVPGFNYKPHRYPEANAKLTQGFLYGSETASTLSSRGVYEFPVEKGVNKEHKDIQCSSYDLERCWWSQLPDDEWAAQDSLPYTMGEFVWTGFDYLGEPTPYDTTWPAHSSYFGIFDLAGLPKDRFYLYKSRWNKNSHTIHLLPHWTWPGREGQPTPVFAYTDWPSAELFVNGKSQGRQVKLANSHLERYRLMWNDVVYQPGKIKVVAYDVLGKIAGTDSMITAGAPRRIILKANQTSLPAGEGHLVYVTASVCDSNGTLCPSAKLPISFSVEGGGTFKSIANGDPTCLESFQASTMHTFSGQLVGIVETNGKPGLLHIKATAPGLLAGETEVKVK
jgi:beta-galactosidase